MVILLHVGLWDETFCKILVWRFTVIERHCLHLWQLNGLRQNRCKGIIWPNDFGDGGETAMMVGHSDLYSRLHLINLSV